MSQVLTPREVISRYIDRNTTGETGPVTVRGVYSRNENDAASSKQWAFDKLADELSDATLKIFIPKELRDFIKNGDTVEMTGTISDYGFRDSGTLQVQMNVFGCVQAKDLFIPKAENDRHRVRRNKAIKGYKDVRRILTELVRDGKTPRIVMIFPGYTVADTDFERAVGECRQYYDIEYRNVPFTDSAGVVRLLKECDGRYDLVCVVRGGGSGLQNLDNVDILAQVAEMKTPVLTAVGHAEDNLFIDSVADLSKETPSLLGSFLKEIVQEIDRNRRALNEQERRYGVLRKVVIGLSVTLAAVVAALVYLVIK